MWEWIASPVGWIIGIGLFVLWLWAFVDMVGKKSLTKTSKGVWAIMFIVFSFLTIIVWFIVRPKR